MEIMSKLNCWFFFSNWFLSFLKFLILGYEFKVDTQDRKDASCFVLLKLL